MSLADAIAAGTGLDPTTDFEIRDDGDGPFLARWDESKAPRPTDDEIAGYVAAYEKAAPERELRAKVRAKMFDYLEALVYQNELADTSKLEAVQTDLALAKTDYDSAKATIDATPIDPVDPVKP